MPSLDRPLKLLVFVPGLCIGFNKQVPGVELGASPGAAAAACWSLLGDFAAPGYLGPTQK